ncbi:BTE_collapsed_G0004390.mRNA.1.CDS.1 [Saccharomyces cerevisiae]|nr:BTE_collapsed_G0004390.mRNA.1.CDS.1 [Saccharomyces cerevisiae]
MFFLPAIAAIPLLMVYYVDFGVTLVFIASIQGIFCSNCVSIVAGVNGLEVGQCIVLAILALLNDLLYFSMGPLK